jgi:hypothetical protein
MSRLGIFFNAYRGNCYTTPQNIQGVAAAALLPTPLMNPDRRPVRITADKGRPSVLLK